MVRDGLALVDTKCKYAAGNQSILKSLVDASQAARRERVSLIQYEKNHADMFANAILQKLGLFEYGDPSVEDD